MPKKSSADDLNSGLDEQPDDYQERTEEKQMELEDRASNPDLSPEYEYSGSLFDKKNKPKISTDQQTNFTFWIKQMEVIYGCWTELGIQMSDVYTNPFAALGMNATLQKLWNNIKHGFEDPYNPKQNSYYDKMEKELESINTRCADMAHLFKRDQVPTDLAYRKLIDDMRFVQSELYRGMSALGVLMRFNKRPAYKKLLDEYDEEPSEAIAGND